METTHRGWNSRGYLPHFDAAGVYQAITYRLADSLPQEVVERIEREIGDLPPDEHAEERRQRCEVWLDRGLGACHLGDQRIAGIVLDAWLHFAGQRYDLCAWVVMPNHVHALIRERPGFPLARVIDSWKTWTARRANLALGRSGTFWQADYWDRFIRDERHYLAAVAYIHDNPAKAGLAGSAAEWGWSSAREHGRAARRAALPGACTLTQREEPPPSDASAVEWEHARAARRAALPGAGTHTHREEPPLSDAPRSDDAPPGEPGRAPGSAALRAALPAWPAGLEPLGGSLADAFGAEAAGDLLAALARPRSPAFRANLLRATAAEVQAACAAAGIRCDPLPFAPWAFATDADGEAALKRSPLMAEGRIYLQSPTSQLAALLADPRPGLTWLDACAAPGGKTGVLAMLAGAATAGLALERARVRYDLLRHNLARQGCAQVEARCCDARHPDPALRRRRFARILVDAPCAGSGTIDPGEARSFAHLAGRYDGYVAIKTEQQYGIVLAAAALLAGDGVLTYCTCSLDPAENEALVAAVLAARPELACVPFPALPPLPTPRRAAALRWCGHDLPPEVAHALRLDPGPGGEGFFVARLARRG